MTITTTTDGQWVASGTRDEVTPVVTYDGGVYDPPGLIDPASLEHCPSCDAVLMHGLPCLRFWCEGVWRG